MPPSSQNDRSKPQEEQRNIQVRDSDSMLAAHFFGRTATTNFCNELIILFFSRGVRTPKENQPTTCKLFPPSHRGSLPENTTARERQFRCKIRPRNFRKKLYRVVSRVPGHTTFAAWMAMK